MYHEGERERAPKGLSDSESESEGEDGEKPPPDAIPDPAGNKPPDAINRE